VAPTLRLLCGGLAAGATPPFSLVGDETPAWALDGAAQFDGLRQRAPQRAAEMIEGFADMAAIITAARQRLCVPRPRNGAAPCSLRPG